MGMRRQVCLAVALFTVAALLTGCDEYTIDVDYQCSDSSSNIQTCKSWRQTGSIKKEIRCFPGDAVLIGKDGPLQMDQVRVGDALLGFDHSTGQVVFSKVRAWIHRDVQSISDMTVLRTSAGLLTTSGKHGIAVRDEAGDTDYSFAEDIQIGHALVSANGSAIPVQGRSTRTTRGLYTPLTGTSNFFVGDSEGSAVLAHSFAHLRHPRAYETAFHGLMRAAELFSRSVHDLDYDGDGKYFHPVVRMLGPVAPIFGVGLDSFYFQFERNITHGSPPERRLQEEEPPAAVGRRLPSASVTQEEEDEDPVWMALTSTLVTPLFMLSDQVPGR
jgi:hypothetical protein